MDQETSTDALEADPHRRPAPRSRHTRPPLSRPHSTSTGPPSSGRFASRAPRHIAAGIALILATFWLRSIRWAVFISPVKRVPSFSLTGSQFIGFTAVALFGRLADLTRPYLISKRVGLSVSSQIAVYTIERIFDLGAAAVLFSFALAATPHDAPHHEIFVRAGIVCLAGTAFLALFAPRDPPGR